MPTMRRMGAQVSLGESASALGHVEFAAVGPEGHEIRVAAGHDGPTVDLVHFVELDDGQRVTTKRFGGMSMDVVLPCTVQELHTEVRAFIVCPDEVAETHNGVSGEPSWAQDMVKALHECGLDADAGALAALPFVVELDDQVVAVLAA